jgi:outer membrane lipoprotein-sorting protein
MTGKGAAPWVGAVLGLAVASSASLASAQTSGTPTPPPRPLDLLTPRPSASTQPGVTPAPRPAQAAESTPQAMIERINAALNEMTHATADFVQTAPDGRRTQGKLYLVRPGKMRFEYERPSALEVISDGRNVAVRDKKLGTQELYGIGQTPLKFLVSDPIDVSKQGKVLSVTREGDSVVLVLEDKNTVTGTSKIRIVFSGDTYTLRRWTVTDPQGYDTIVQLSNLSTQRRPENRLFVIDVQSMPVRDN